jgi:hypothetical protein
VSARADRPVQLADVARRARHAVSFSAYAEVSPPRPEELDAAVRVVHAPNEPAAALVQLNGGNITHNVPDWLRDAGYEVVPEFAGLADMLLVRCGTATDSRVFEHVLGRCDLCWHDQDYDKDLSEHLMRLLREVVPADTDDYFEVLEAFADRNHARLKQLHRDLGHHSGFHLNGRYVLARQPETLILLERAASAPKAFTKALADAPLLPHLRDLAAAWEDTARQLA